MTHILTIHHIVSRAEVGVFDAKQYNPIQHLFIRTMVTNLLYEQTNSIITII